MKEEKILGKLNSPKKYPLIEVQYINNFIKDNEEII
jgi:hypothetical protein